MQSWMNYKKKFIHISTYSHNVYIFVITMKRILAYTLMAIPVILWVLLTLTAIVLEYIANSIYWVLDHIEYFFDHINFKFNNHDTN